MISTRDLSGLPDVDGLKRLLQSLAMLDAILSPEWQFRYYSFNSKWSRGKQMGSMRNGQGDDFFALFNKHGCFLKGFAHEAVMSPYGRTPKAVWPGVLDSVPAEFEDGLNEPAFSMEDTTFCIWRRYGDQGWHCGEIEFPAARSRRSTNRPDPDGSVSLLSPLDGNPETYLAWASDYFGLDEGDGSLTIDAVRHLYGHQPLTEKLVASINPDVALKDLAADVAEIGYPRRAGKK
jgi:hypothetical protein